MTDPSFPSAAYDRWKTQSPEVDAVECRRCGCVEGADNQKCDKPELCSCHWSQEERDAMAADEKLAQDKEDRHD